MEFMQRTALLHLALCTVDKGFFSRVCGGWGDKKSLTVVQTAKTVFADFPACSNTALICFNDRSSAERCVGLVSAKRKELGVG